MNNYKKISIKKKKKRIPVPQKPPKVEDNPKSYKREKEKLKQRKKFGRILPPMNECFRPTSSFRDKLMRFAKFENIVTTIKIYLTAHCDFYCSSEQFSSLQTGVRLRMRWLR